MKLSEKLLENHNEIIKYLYCGYVNWDSLIARIERQECNPIEDFLDEQIWTFIVACGFAIDKEKGLNTLCKLLTGDENLKTAKIWIEVLPKSPRVKEGPTHLDLVIGDIKLRSGTESGIELIHNKNSWIAFCEMKWYSDISTNVTYDKYRNQLARVIENAILFNDNNCYPTKVYVNLISPGIFKQSGNKSRLYSYKFEEYVKSSKVIENDLKNCMLDFSNQNMKSQIYNRISVLELKWTTFDELFKYIPESKISCEIKNFESKFNKAK